MKQKFDVAGMGCAMCVAAVEKAVKALDGINEVNVSLIENSMIVDYDEGKVSADSITEAVDKVGYKASLPAEKTEEPQKKKKRLFF